MVELASMPKLYKGRFDPDERRRKNAVWKVLCRHFFQRYVRPDDSVLDLGAGMCEFINHIDAATKIAVDSSIDVTEHAGEDVRVVVALSTDLGELPDASVDVVFASNFFEHLPTRDAFLETLAEICRLLRPGGRLLILQPNIRIIGGQYWDFLDHHIPITDRTLVEALELVDLKVAEVRPRFLPFTTKSALPQHPLLVRLFLMVRPAQWLLGGQAWVVGVKS